MMNLKHRKLSIFCEFAKMFEKVVGMEILEGDKHAVCDKCRYSVKKLWTSGKSIHGTFQTVDQTLLKTKSARLAYCSEAKPGTDRLEIYLSLNCKSHKKMLTLFTLKGYIEF